MSNIVATVIIRSKFKIALKNLIKMLCDNLTHLDYYLDYTIKIFKFKMIELVYI